MKKYPIILALFLITVSLFAQNYKDMLKEVDNLVSFTETDFQAFYTITQTKPREGISVTKADVYRRDKDEKYVIIIKEPSVSRGQGYLKIKKTLWFYDPESRRFSSSSSKDKFQNTNARNSDFTSSTLARDYKIEKAYAGTLGIHDCTIMELKGKNKDLTYPYMKIWVNEQNLILKSEDYSLSKQLLRISAFTSYKKKANKYIPMKVIIVDALLGANVAGKFVNERTVIELSDPSFDDLESFIFSKSFLESESR